MLTTTPISDLPWDIVIEILSRLPVKSLTRFKCVSTSLYNLISNDPLLKKKHLYHHQSSLKFLVPHQPNTFRGSAPSFSVLSGDALEEITDLEILIEKRLPPYGYYFNSCDGLFCLGVYGGDFIIWNPSTRQVKRFQPCGHREDERGYIPLSLAYDSRTNVYKLLGVFRDNIRLRFYSTEMKMWRCVEDYPPRGDVSFGSKPIITNGAFHWLCFRTSNVVMLDICDETYGMIAMPKSFCETKVPPRLCVMKGKLCVMCEAKSRTSWEVWMMNEYGVADSMTRMFIFSLNELPNRYFRPIYAPENTDLLLIYDYSCGELFFKDTRVLCDEFDGEIKTESVPFAFFESLVSPHTCLEEVSSSNEIVAKNFFATTSRDNLHSHNARSEKAFSSEIVGNMSRVKRFLKRLCFSLKCF